MIKIIVLQYYLKDIFCIQMYTLVTLAHILDGLDERTNKQKDQTKLQRVKGQKHLITEEQKDKIILRYKLYKLDGVGPVDNRTLTHKLHHFVIFFQRIIFILL